jgi:quinol-cytochrome oxidoreductase complex cytochrome b subunit
MWAVTVGSHIAAAPPLAGAEGPVHLFLFGEKEISAATLFRFYVLHCIAVPVVLLILVGVHFWRIRKDGGLAGPL